MTEVSRILSCGTHYEVLKLNHVDHVPLFVDAQRIRKHYKALAMQVHPDKTRVTDAEAAFKRLGEAYECLIDEESQRKYLQQLQTNRKQSQPQKTRSKRQKKTQPSSKPSSNTKSDPIPTRKRTSEEIWQLFQREEEEAARQEFQAKGFERHYNLSSSKRTKPMVSIPLEEQEEMLDSELEIKAAKWATWNTPVSTQTTTVSDAIPTTNASSFCCMLCRRKFPTMAARERHIKFSKLHVTNLQRKQT